MDISKKVILDLLLNNKWTIKQYNKLDLSNFKKEEREFLALLKKMKEEGVKINAENVFKKGGLPNLSKYVTLSNEITMHDLADSKSRLINASKRSNSRFKWGRRHYN